MTQVTPTYVLEVDWDNDGTFGNAAADITTDAMNIECSRGRDYSQPGAGAIAGSLTATLRNDDGKYSPRNSSSPLFGLNVPGIKVRFRTTTPTAANIWAGYISEITPYRAQGGAILAALRCAGGFWKLGRMSFIPVGNVIADTADWMDDVLDYVGWPAGDRSLDHGAIMGGRNWAYFPDVYTFAERNALTVLKDLEAIGSGFLYEGTDFEIVHEAQDYRLITSRCLTSQATFSDAGSDLPYIGIESLDPLNQLFNVATAAQQHEDNHGVADVRWTSAAGQVIAPGDSVTFKAIYPSPQKDPTAFAYVTLWTTPVAGTDVTCTGALSSDLTIAVVETLGNRLTFTVTNDSPSDTATLTLVQARGTYIISDGAFVTTQEDATSITAYGRREYPIQAVNHAGAQYTEEWAQWQVGRRKDPHSVVTVRLASNHDSDLFDAAVSLAISDRVTLIADNQAALGISGGDFYVERIAHSIGHGNTSMFTEFTLSATDFEDSLWVLGTSELGVDTALG